MFGPVESSPYDLQFRLFRIPVRVHWSFWLGAGYFAWPQGASGQRALALLLIGIACVFVSILVHEMGHALTAKAFGWPPHVVLHWMGGYASYIPTWGHSTARSVMVTFAGPCAGFLLYGLVKGFTLIPGALEYVGEGGWIAIQYLEYINLWWGIVNLAPVYPLDGGQISRYVLVHWYGHQGRQLSLQLSVLCGAAIAVYFFYIDRGLNFATVLFGLLAFQSLQELQGNRY
ncbi:MAG TPA: site-2 protease family protein [Planctomycetaceae bacterium]|nr:site-2 protease family protein [Planctomycetaceae bacterium]